MIKGKKYKKNDVVEILSFSNYEIAKENMIKEAVKLLKKYKINKKNIKIKKEDMEFIDKRKLKIEMR